MYSNQRELAFDVVRRPCSDSDSDSYGAFCRIIIIIIFFLNPRKNEGGKKLLLLLLLPILLTVSMTIILPCLAKRL